MDPALGFQAATPYAEPSTGLPKQKRLEHPEGVTVQREITANPVGVNENIGIGARKRSGHGNHVPCLGAHEIRTNVQFLEMHTKPKIRPHLIATMGLRVPPRGVKSTSERG